MQKTAMGQFSSNVSGGLTQTNYCSDPEKLGGEKIGQTSSMRVQSLMEIGGLDARRQEMKNNAVFSFVFVCMYLCVYCCHVPEWS